MLWHSDRNLDMNGYALINNAANRWFGGKLNATVLLPLFAALLLLVIWLGTLHLIGVERRNAERAAIESSADLIRTYEAQVIRNLAVIEQTLKVVRYAHDVKENDLSLSVLTERGLLPSSIIFSVDVADADGGIVSSNRQNAGNIADQAHFRAHEGNVNDSLFVSKAVLNPATSERELHFSRRLNRSDGAFAGVVVVSVDPAYFTSSYEHSTLGRNGVLALLGTDGVFRALRTGDRLSFGGSVDYPAATQSDFSSDSGQRQVPVNPWDGVRRFTKARQLHGFPLAAIIGLSAEEQLGNYYRTCNKYLWQASLASVFLLLVFGVLTRLSWLLSRSQRRIQADQARYYAAAEASLDAFFVLRCVRDQRGMIVDFELMDTNSRGEKLLGRPKAELLGASLVEFDPQCRENGLFAHLADVADSGKVHEVEWKNRSGSLNGEWLYRQVVRIEDGVIAIVRDISERKRLQMQIEYQATHDTLTGLANRRFLQDRLAQSIAYASRYGHPLWVAFIDLDRFKFINDSLGHKVGDTFLRIIAERLQSAVRATDIVARLGGDEFVLVLSGNDDDDLPSNNIQRIMDVVTQPLDLDGKDFSVTCSIGVANYPADADRPETLIEYADMAMYRAKETGRNNFQFFTATMNERLNERLRIEQELHQAIERNELVLHYQPRVDLRGGEITGMEALIRWQHPELGMVPPIRFIGVAEETGLIVPIGDWVFRTACAQNKAWQDAGLCHLRVSINLSARQFAQPDLLQTIKDALRETGLEARYLEIELTESLMMSDVENAIHILQALKELGVYLSIDDFGTGYSSLAYLKRFPIDVLKIDRSFVSDIPANANDAAITSSIIALAHSLELEVVAEGVETAEQLAFLQQRNCDVVQGYYFSRPVPVTDFEIL
ncbi:MAG: hypothetical protein K0S28_2091, partial [Paucimonas sp.]|nr:hypothetical protein [Paucimonas sp.]